MTAPLPAPAELPPVVAAFDEAQRRTIAMMADVVARLERGMHARDVVELAETRLGEHGFTGWYHPPEVEIGQEIGRRGPLPRVGRGPAIEVGSLVCIDLGPASADAYGDFGVTRVYAGEGDEPYIVQQARECTRAACGFASRWKTCGEIHVVSRAWAVNARLALRSEGAVGHRVLPREGLLATGWPRSAHAATLLGRNRLHRLNPVRMNGMFAIRPVVTDGTWSAAFEEMVYIHDDVKRVLGRAGLAEVGTL